MTGPLISRLYRSIVSLFSGTSCSLVSIVRRRQSRKMIQRILLAMLALFILPAASAGGRKVDSFAAVLCGPPYSIEAAMALYEEVKSPGQPDTSIMGTAIYHLPVAIHRGGFTGQALVFAGSSVGILLDGEVAQEAARRYDLQPEKSHLLGALKVTKKSYHRR